MRAGEFDLALLFEFQGVESAAGSDLAVTPLLDDPMHVALPVEHALATKPQLALADLRFEDWVQTSASSPCARHVVRSCLAAGFEPRVTFESDDYETVQGLVAAGVGVALVPRLALTRLHPGSSCARWSRRVPCGASLWRRRRRLVGRRRRSRCSGCCRTSRRTTSTLTAGRERADAVARPVGEDGRWPQARRDAVKNASNCCGGP